MTTQTELLTANDLLRLYSTGVTGELIRGVLCRTVPAGGEHGEIVMNLGVAMGNVVKSRRLGRLAGSDSGVLIERNPDTVREPDLAFISAERLPLDIRVTGYYETIPDIVVEVTSPTDSRREVNDKSRMWHSHGVRLVWAVHTNPRSVDVHREDGSIVTLSEDDMLDGGDVLPGFTCKVRDIFEL